MKIYLMETIVGRCIVINKNNEWYYMADISGCDIDCIDVHIAIKNLYKCIKKIYNSGNTVDISKFERIKEYGGCNIWEFLDSIHDYEIEHGVPHSDLSAIHFICEV